MTLDDRPSSLGQTIEVRASNRPVRVAYLVPFDNTPTTHLVLDGAFYESYTRWAGVFTLFIPTSASAFQDHPSYTRWLEFFDPDFIYTFVEIGKDLIEELDRRCSPIAIIKHEIRRHPEDREPDWRDYIPSLGHYISPLSSITTVHSPATVHPYPVPMPEPERETTVLTQYPPLPANRFFADNFGTAFAGHRATNPIAGLFRTLCLCPPDTPSYMNVGSERCHSLADAIHAVTTKRAIPIVRFAMAHSEAIPKPSSYGWSYAFNLFIGDSPLDRIHFWNSRHFPSSDATSLSAFIAGKSLFDDADVVKELGEYLNRTNFLGHGSQYQVCLRSHSQPIDVLNAARSKLQAQTYNIVLVEKPALPAIPEEADLKNRYGDLSDTTLHKVSEDANTLIATDPAHFIYVPPRARGLADGDWIVELDIQRHNNLSRFSNVVDSWVLPRRTKVVTAFTKRYGKVTSRGRLALIPERDRRYFPSDRIRQPPRFELYLRSDEEFFRFLVLAFVPYAESDLRKAVTRPAYKEMRVSDKGQNLRGVTSMLENLRSAYEILTNRYWRTVLAEAKEDTTRPLTFDWEKLDSFIPKDAATTERVAKALRLEQGQVVRYLRASLMDTLEHLVRASVFYQVAQWRCRYCGHTNSRSFDNMKIRNACDICEREYFAPIDLEWKYELNDFVYRSLNKHSGLPVLWALGVLQEHRLGADSYWYLPEVDLYENYDDPEKKNEIDILCMRGGKFFAVEAKRTVAMFLNKEGAVDKFVKVITWLRPDVAMLAFERYGEGEDSAAIKSKLLEVSNSIKQRLQPNVELEVLVGEDSRDFSEFPVDLGWYGRRTGDFDA